MNPVTGTITAVTVPTAGTPHTGHNHSTTTSTPAPTSTIVMVTQTVTAAVVIDEAGQPGNNTTTAGCQSSPVYYIILCDVYAYPDIKFYGGKLVLKLRLWVFLQLERLSKKI